MFPGILNSIDVVVHPSRMIETFSLVVHQALQYNIPVISSNMGAVGEIFCNHHITFSSQNSAELAERMYEVVNNKKYTNIERKDMNLFSSINKHSQKLLSYYEK
jgi:glycosyltransferase involved in cell wall biosynthesis